MKRGLPPYLGSWAMYCDVAGQVRPDTKDCVRTVAAVGVRKDMCHLSKRKLLRLFGGSPVKFKKGGEAVLTKVLQFIAAERCPVAVVAMHTTEPARWAEYFRDGEMFRRSVDSVGAPARHLRYLGPAVVVRMHFMGIGFATLAGSILRRRQPWKGMGIVDWECVADSDLPEGRAREQFALALEEWGQRSPRLTVIPAEQRVVGRTATEQEEPLLLLADYMAGLYHHADVRVELERPIISPDHARTAVDAFRIKHAHFLDEGNEEFSEMFPLNPGDPSVARN